MASIVVSGGSGLIGKHLCKLLKDKGHDVAPEHISNKTLTHRLLRALHKNIWLPNVPKIVWYLILGKMAVMLLERIRVSSKKICPHL